ncbi:MAG TPA: site-2 protease family protein [Pyrinomonadaceae bacterium]|jgi:membrane-associated protease RseP (regulator of RpoE activity)
MATQDFYLNQRRRAMRPKMGTWLRHLLLLVLTLVTATIAGVLQPFGAKPIFADVPMETWTDIANFFYSLPRNYLVLIVQTLQELATDAALLKHGLSFSVSLLFILTAHESGHYIACRIYGVDATLPYFIPTPPMIGPAGTLGAFIKILSPMPSRHATFDIGVAGPIAGFLALIPIAVIGFLTWQYAPPSSHVAGAANLGFVFSDPLMMQLMAWIFNVNLSLPTMANPFYFAAWLGLLVTALNLIPSGQLDGGHAIYAVFGERIHYWTGRIAFAAMALFSITGFYFYNSPSGFLFAVLLGVMMRIRHPEPLDNTPLDFKRKAVAALVLLIFILCFVPFPIQIR